MHHCLRGDGRLCKLLKKSNRQQPYSGCVYYIHIQGTLCHNLPIPVFICTPVPISSALFIALQKYIYYNVYYTYSMYVCLYRKEFVESVGKRHLRGSHDFAVTFTVYGHQKSIEEAHPPLPAGMKGRGGVRKARGRGRRRRR